MALLLANNPCLLQQNCSKLKITTVRRKYEAKSLFFSPDMPETNAALSFRYKCHCSSIPRLNVTIFAGSRRNRQSYPRYLANILFPPTNFDYFLYYLYHFACRISSCSFDSFGKKQKLCWGFFLRLFFPPTFFAILVLATIVLCAIC